MVSLNHFSEEHFTDPITIHSMIKKFHKHSKVVDLTFQIFNGYIRISGSELTMRYFTYTFFGISVKVQLDHFKTYWNNVFPLLSIKRF